MTTEITSTGAADAVPAVLPATVSNPAVIKRAVIVVKETYLDLVKAAGDHVQLAEIAAGKPGLEAVQQSHDQHESGIEDVTRALEAAGITLDTIHRNTEGLSVHLSGVDLIVTVGGDGTFLRASHEIAGDIPVVGVNSAPITSFGHFCICDAPGFAAVLTRIIAGDLKPSRLLRLNLAIDGVAVAEPVLNEVLVAHKHPAGTSRYRLTVGQNGEAKNETAQHKCSGLIVAPPAGTTGFLRSESGTILPITARQYTFMERAPFLRIGEDAVLKSAVVEASATLEIVSQMQDGRLFIDGDHIEYDFPRGAVLTVSAGQRDLVAYVDPECHTPYLK
jgi:NAD+ kinase